MDHWKTGPSHWKIGPGHWKQRGHIKCSHWKV